MINHHRILIFTMVLSSNIAAVVLTTSKADEMPFQAPDCGLNALYTLLELNDHHVDLSKLRDKLPPQTSKGYTFLDLKNAAAGVGYDLQGITLNDSSNLPRVPAIVFLSDRENGHFVVTKPVENSQSLVHVFDAPSQPRIVNESILTRDSHWTGRVIILKSNSYKSKIILFFCTLPMIMIIQKVLQKSLFPNVVPRS